MSKHTPGPWDIRILANEPGFATRVGVVQHGGRFVNALAIDETSSANARLIAAAPELLEAAINILTGIEFHGDELHTKFDLTELREAIAKAEGEKK